MIIKIKLINFLLLRARMHTLARVVIQIFLKSQVLLLEYIRARSSSMHIMHTPSSTRVRARMYAQTLFFIIHPQHPRNRTVRVPGRDRK